MDGKVIVWEGPGSTGGRSGTGGSGDPRYTELLGHYGSVSALASPCGTLGTGANQAVIPNWTLGSLLYAREYPRSGGHLLVSTGYDKTVRIWDTSPPSASAPLQLAEMRGHKAPILTLALRNPPCAQLSAAPQLPPEHPFLALTGDRDGVAKVWDIGAGACVGTLTGHRGHLTAATWMSNATVFGSAQTEVAAGRGVTDDALASVALTGAQDGHLRVWDARAGRSQFNLELHSSTEGSGAIGDIAVTQCPTNGMAAFEAGAMDGGYETLVVTAGADKTICVLDPRMGFAERHRFTEHSDFIYSLHAVGPLVFSGGGDGIMLAHDICTGRVLWGLGANMAAVRCISFVGSMIVASGDDGKVLVYDFE
jgi:WD40 repeat protein